MISLYGYVLAYTSLGIVLALLTQSESTDINQLLPNFYIRTAVIGWLVSSLS